MLIASLLVNDSNIRCQDKTSPSKKRILENVSALLAKNTKNITENVIFHALLERERLGSTGLGKGVAIPHARIPNLTHSIATMMTLAEPVNYEAADSKPVDIVFALLVPEDGNDYHLQNLSRLVTLFRDSSTCQSIRETTDASKMFDLLLAIDD